MTRLTVFRVAAICALAMVLLPSCTGQRDFTPLSESATLASSTAAVAAHDPSISRAKADTVDEKASATALAQPIRDCVANRDTTHAVFHGCVDWHSAVHGNYALRVISRLDADPSAANLADTIANGDALKSEFASISAGDLDEEIPYGFSWFLILDSEASSPDMAQLAVTISARLHEWITEHIHGDEILQPEYHNLSFAAFALHRWYVNYSADNANDFRREVASSLVASIGPACANTRSADEFFDTCATLLLALADFDANDDATIPDNELERLVAAVEQQHPLLPEDISTVHAAGLNFSRSWALYMAAAALNQSEVLDSGDDYFLATLNSPELWNENYDAYSHWVAQFGVLALDLRSQTRAHLMRV